jgi:hypothetical protein
VFKGEKTLFIKDCILRQPPEGTRRSGSCLLGFGKGSNDFFLRCCICCRNLGLMRKKVSMEPCRKMGIFWAFTSETYRANALPPTREVGCRYDLQMETSREVGSFGPPLRACSGKLSLDLMIIEGNKQKRRNRKVPPLLFKIYGNVRTNRPVSLVWSRASLSAMLESR